MCLEDMIKESFECKCDIHVKIDNSSKNKKNNCIQIKGTTSSILTGISVLISDLIDNGMPKELIKGAVDIGLGNNNEEKKEHIIAGSVELKGKQAKKFMKFLKELGVK